MFDQCQLSMSTMSMSTMSMSRRELNNHMLVRHLYNLKKREKTPMEGYYLNLLHGCFPRFLNCTNSSKSLKAALISSI